MGAHLARPLTDTLAVSRQGWVTAPQRAWARCDSAYVSAVILGAMTDLNSPDPTEHSRWRPLRLLQAAMDADIARIYAEAEIDGLKPSFAMELMRLHGQGPMTIRALAESVQRTHSAISQKVAAMKTAGWVQTTTGADARSKEVRVTAKAERVGRRLAAEWRATEAAIADIEVEIPYPLSRVVADIEAALARKSFHDRIAENLAGDPAWGNSDRPAYMTQGDQ